MEASDINFSVVQLMEITGLDRDNALNVLKRNNYDIERAINDHLENENGENFMIPVEENNDNGAESNDSSDSSNQKVPLFSASPSVAAASTSVSSLSASTSSSSSNPGPSSGHFNNVHENEVRAPIPGKREQLLLPEEDNFRVRKRPHFTVCPLRNFAREAELQEQQIAAAAAAATGSNDAINFQGLFTPLPIDQATYNFRPRRNRGNDSSSSNGSTNNGSNHASKRSRLEDLFRPPTDLLFWGTFQAARDYATISNRWLIVNLQDHSEFKSQILNRDIWTEPELKELILKYFIFWQVSVDNSEGLRFKTFYHVQRMPYVCIIDPRTGEEKLSCDIVTAQAFCSDLNDFLSENSYVLDTNKASSSSSSATTAIADKSKCLENSNEKKTSELSEEDQLELAIRNSLKEIQSTTTNSDKETKRLSQQSTGTLTTTDDSFDGDTNTTADSEDAISICDVIDENSQQLPISPQKSLNQSQKQSQIDKQQETNEQYLSDENDDDIPKTRIQLRLPGGERNQLIWPSNTKIKKLKLYVEQNYSNIIAKNPYKILQTFPKLNILDLDDMLTLEAAKLHPNVILHLHIDE